MVPLTNSLKHAAACRSVPQHAAASQNFLGDRWCLFRTKNDPPMIFLDFDPPPPAPEYLFFRGVGGGQKFFAYCGQCVCFWTRCVLRTGVFHFIWVLGAQGGGGDPKGLVHSLLMQFFTLGSSKIEVFESFFDTVIT